MDSLALLHAEAAWLLGRVDATLMHHGAPADHRIWLLLRGRGLLPGDAMANVVAWMPGPLLDRAQLLRTHRRRCTEVDDLVRGESGWEGVAGPAFDARLAATRAKHEVFAQNTGTMADHLEDLAGWIAGGRVKLAQRLAAVLMSAQAVTLKIGASATLVTPTARAAAAADIGAELLSEVDRFWTGALELSHGWSSRLRSGAAVKATIRPPEATLRVEL